MNSKSTNPYGNNDSHLESNDKRSVYLLSQLPDSCPGCGQEFSRKEIWNRKRRKYRFGALLFILLVMAGGLVATPFVGTFAIVVSIPLAGWAFTWNKQVNIQCGHCDWSSSYVVGNASTSRNVSTYRNTPGYGRSTSQVTPVDSDYIEQETEKFKELEGRILTDWYLDELAIGGDAPEFVWYDPSVPMLYLSVLAMKIDNEWFEIDSFEHDPTDDYWNDYYYTVTIQKASQHRAKIYESGEPIHTPDPESGSRFNRSIPLPTGIISEVLVTDTSGLDRGLAAVSFQIDNRELYLTAGSIEGCNDGTYVIGRFGYDFFLLQVDGSRPIGQEENSCDK